MTCSSQHVPGRIPRVLFRRILEGARFSPTMELLREYDPSAARGLANLQALGDADFQALVELEGLPRATSRRAYIQAGGVLRTCPPPTFNQRTESARLYEHSR